MQHFTFHRYTAHDSTRPPGTSVAEVPGELLEREGAIIASASLPADRQYRLGLMDISWNGHPRYALIVYETTHFSKGAPFAVSRQRYVWPL